MIIGFRYKDLGFPSFFDHKYFGYVLGVIIIGFTLYENFFASAMGGAKAVTVPRSVGGIPLRLCSANLMNYSKTSNLHPRRWHAKPSRFESIAKLRQRAHGRRWASID